MSWSQHSKDVPLINDEINSTADSDAKSLFDYSDDKETDIISNANTDSLSKINNKTDDDASLFDNKVRHPPKYYLAGAANLNVNRLRQRQYDPKTQDRLNWVKKYYI